MSGVLLAHAQDGILTLTLNRPQAHNALDPELLCRLVDALDAFEADTTLQVAVLTGAGGRAFCAGGDLGTTLPLLSGQRAPRDAWDRRLLDDPRVRTLAPLREEALGKPLIAAVQGICMAAGAEILLGTDIRVVSDDAVFAWPEARHALIPFVGTLARLPRQIPYCMAMELMLTGTSIDAARAYELGLVNQVVPAGQVLERAHGLARRMAANGPLALRQIKQVARQALGRPLDDGYALEDAACRVIMASADAREGPLAFMEKRPPVYRGR